jgi:hypothetical protein
VLLRAIESTWLPDTDSRARGSGLNISEAAGVGPPCGDEARTVVLARGCAVRAVRGRPTTRAAQGTAPTTACRSRRTAVGRRPDRAMPAETTETPPAARGADTGRNEGPVTFGSATAGAEHAPSRAQRVTGQRQMPRGRHGRRSAFSISRPFASRSRCHLGRRRPRTGRSTTQARRWRSPRWCDAAPAGRRNQPAAVFHFQRADTGRNEGRGHATRPGRSSA